MTANGINGCSIHGAARPTDYVISTTPDGLSKIVCANSDPIFGACRRSVIQDCDIVECTTAKSCVGSQILRAKSVFCAAELNACGRSTVGGSASIEAEYLECAPADEPSTRNCPATRCTFTQLGPDGAPTASAVPCPENGGTLGTDPSAGGSGGGANGDPHILRWKKEKRDSFHGECDLVLLKGPSIDVHIRTTIREYYSFIEAAAVRINKNIVLQVSSDGVYVNSKKFDEDSLDHLQVADYVFSKTAAPMGTKKSNKRGYVLKINDDSYLEFKVSKKFMAVSVFGLAADFGETVGLMGDYHTGDMFGRDGRIMDENDFDAFGHEWQVHPEEDGLLFSVVREPQFPQQKCIMPTLDKRSASTSTRRHLRGENSELLKLAEEACIGHGSDIDLCIEDVLVTGDLAVAGAW